MQQFHYMYFLFELLNCIFPLQTVLLRQTRLESRLRVFFILISARSILWHWGNLDRPFPCKVRTFQLTCVLSMGKRIIMIRCIDEMYSLLVYRIPHSPSNTFNVFLFCVGNTVITVPARHLSILSAWHVPIVTKAQAEFRVLVLPDIRPFPRLRKSVAWVQSVSFRHPLEPERTYRLRPSICAFVTIGTRS